MLVSAQPLIQHFSRQLCFQLKSSCEPSSRATQNSSSVYPCVEALCVDYNHIPRQSFTVFLDKLLPYPKLYQSTSLFLKGCLGYREANIQSIQIHPTTKRNESNGPSKPSKSTPYLVYSNNGPDTPLYSLPRRRRTHNLRRRPHGQINAIRRTPLASLKSLTLIHYAQRPAPHHTKRYPTPQRRT